MTGRTYIVQPGDTLESVAKQYLGDESGWQYLASINKIVFPYHISPGEALLIDPVEVDGKINWIYVWILAIVVVAITAYFWFNG